MFISSYNVNTLPNCCYRRGMILLKESWWHASIYMENGQRYKRRLVQCGIRSIEFVDLKFRVVIVEMWSCWNIQANLGWELGVDARTAQRDRDMAYRRHKYGEDWLDLVSLSLVRGIASLGLGVTMRNLCILKLCINEQKHGIIRHQMGRFKLHKTQTTATFLCTSVLLNAVHLQAAADYTKI